MSSDLNIVYEVHHLLLCGVTAGPPQRPDQALKITRINMYIQVESDAQAKDNPNETIIASEHITDYIVL